MNLYNKYCHDLHFTAESMWWTFNKRRWTFNKILISTFLFKIVYNIESSTKKILCQVEWWLTINESFIKTCGADIYLPYRLLSPEALPHILYFFTLTKFLDPKFYTHKYWKTQQHQNPKKYPSKVKCALFRIQSGTIYTWQNFFYKSTDKYKRHM